MGPRERSVSSRLIFTCVRNEGPFLLEWVAFHRLAGFSDVLIFTNDCDDGSDVIAARLDAMGLAKHVPQGDTTERGPQWTALRSDVLGRALAEADWAMHLDTDEFLNLPDGLDGLIGAMGEAVAISLPWRFFGNAGVARFEDALVTEQFTRTGPYPLALPRQALMFKTLFRPDAFEAPGIHAPRPEGDVPLWLNGNGRKVSAGFHPKRPLLAGPDVGNGLGQINHYALKSRESFLVKAARGLPNRRDVSIDLSYWVLRNFNSEVDRGLADQAGPVAALRAEWLQDAELGALHAEAVRWHRAEIERLIATEAGVTLFQETAMATGSAPPPAEETQRIYKAMTTAFQAKAAKL